LPQVLRDFFALADGITDEIQHKRWLKGLGPALGGFLRLAADDQVAALPWCLAVAINFLLLVGLRRSAHRGMYFRPEGFRGAVQALGQLLLAANLTRAVGAAALHGPVLWAAVRRRARAAALRDHRLSGSARMLDLARDAAAKLAGPTAAAVAVLAAQALVDATGRDTGGAAVATLFRCAALLVLVGVGSAAYAVCNQRPLLLKPGPQAFVFLVEAVRIEGIPSTLIYTLLNVRKNTQKGTFAEPR
jgi:hypothetical protein